MTDSELEALAANRDYLSALLEKGLGRAVLFLRDHDPILFRDVVLHACTHNQVFDRQMNGSRSRYLFDIIHETGEVDFYRRPILDALRNLPKKEEEDGYWQMYEIARYFAQDGDVEARATMFEAFRQQIEIHDFTGVEDIILLDGMQGFLFAYNRFYEVGAELEDGHPISSWFYYLEDRDGKEEAKRLLEDAALQTPSLSSLLKDRWKQRDERRRKWREKEVDWEYAAVRNWVEQAAQGKGRGYLLRASRLATEEALRHIADDLRTETDPDLLFAILRLFKKRAYPGDPALLLKLAGGEDDAIALAALEALCLLPSPQARALALDLASRPPLWEGIVSLLSATYESGDEEKVAHFLAQTERLDDDHYHWLGMDVLGFYTANPEAEALPSLRLIYENGRCTFCRQSVVRDLAKRGILPEWMQEECLYDAEMDTRSVAAKYVPNVPYVGEE